jgi:hypothetical protein
MSLLSKVVSKAPALPPRIYLYAPEKWGKSSFAAHAPKPIFVMSQGETGLLTLIESGRVPETPHFPDDCTSWPQLVEYVRALLNEDHSYESLVLDTSNGAERLLVAHVTKTEFGGKPEKFNSYGKGPEACIRHWQDFLMLLDSVRVKRRMLIVMLAHTKIKTVNNPTGENYDQLRPEGNDKLWPLTHKWADVIAAGAFDVYVKETEDGKAKATNGQNRQIYVSVSPAVVAGNRYGMTGVISCGQDAKTGWSNFYRALTKAKASGDSATVKADAPAVIEHPTTPTATATTHAEPVEAKPELTAAEVLKWIEDATDFPALAEKLNKADLPPSIKAEVKPAFLAKKEQLSKPAEQPA